MYELVATNRFKKDVKLAKKRGYDLSKLSEVLDLLASGVEIPAKHKDHALTGNWVGYRELHISPGWLLVYFVDEEVLVLTLARTGSHSDLF